VTGKAGFEKNYIFRLLPCARTWRYHLRRLFRNMVSLNFWPLIRIVRAIFGKVPILCSPAHPKAPNFGTGLFRFTALAQRTDLGWVWMKCVQPFRRYWGAHQYTHAIYMQKHRRTGGTSKITF
jgi:hypothetical protein